MRIHILSQIFSLRTIFQSLLAVIASQSQFCNPTPLYLHFIMRVIQLVITIALLSYQESSGVAALSSPLRGAKRRAKSGKTTKKKGNSEEATVRNPL
jgi:hypothetical protein